ncbi:MAG: hypothetical protein IJY69_03495 [Clostridia bacterium]|nr:hypothetical protein [Clostridia bacterium]
MRDNIISLSGKWLIDYVCPEVYESESIPDIDSENVARDKGSAVEVCVPGYFEDMLDTFRTTPLHARLSWNPTYTLQTYPQAGYCPDLTLPNPVGSFLYKRTFTLGDIGKNPVLYVGGVQNTLSAWINGVYLGRHEGYSAEFTLDIPDGTLSAGRNEIALVVSNNRLKGYKGRPVSGLTSRAANECTGGIWGDVELRFHPDGLRDVCVRVDGDCSGFTVIAVGAECAEKTVRVFDGDTEICSHTLSIGESKIHLSSLGMEKWSPSSPKLYKLTVSTVGETLERRFGIRRLDARATKLYLNGEPYYFRGTCEHCYHPITVHPTRDKNYYRRVIRTLKELGFNSIRFHTYVPMPEYMEAADELGMIIEVETPNNTTYAEWVEIVNKCRQYTSVCAFSSGNEMVIDEDYIDHLSKVAEYVHGESDALFSPMSAMRGIEYFSYGDHMVEEPFPHNPTRLDKLSRFCDIYNSYSLGLTSYDSSLGDHETLDKRNAIYKKPILSHEICIHGTYIDLSLMDRYEGSRIGDTRFMSSVKDHLRDVGLLDRANLYYRNSVRWQMMLRKHCFELMRRTDTFAGYDFLGDIDTHWHTFGYCVGMMNEFYELKAGESVQNVVRYNSDTVLLCDLPLHRSFTSGDRVNLPVLLSSYGEKIESATLNIRITFCGKVILRRDIRVKDILWGGLTELYSISFKLPAVSKPERMKIEISLHGGNTDTENEWETYVFPRVREKKAQYRELSDIKLSELIDKMRRGERVLLLGTGPFAYADTRFQLSIAGRTNGHLATVISDHPLMESFPHDGWCNMAFANMLNSRAAILDIKGRPHKPIIDIATSYKNAHREAMLFEYGIGKGKLLVCTLNLDGGDPASVWLRSRLREYVASDAFEPEQTLTESELYQLASTESIEGAGNENAAQNKNDITMN